MSFSDMNHRPNNSYLVRISSDILSFLKPVIKGNKINLEKYDIARLENLKQFLMSAIAGSKVINDSKAELQFQSSRDLTPTPVSAFGIALEAFDDSFFSPTDNGEMVNVLSNQLDVFTGVIDYMMKNGQLDDSKIEDSQNLVSFLEGINNSIILFDRMASENDRDFAFSA